MYINPRWLQMMMLITVIAILTSSCTEFAMLSSTAGVAASQNVYAKAYSGVDVLTIISTEKDIKTHVYNHLTERPRNPPSGSGSGSSTEKDHSRRTPHLLSGCPSSGCVSERNKNERQ